MRLAEENAYVGRWDGTIVVAGTGPGLTLEVAEYCRYQFVIAVNDAYLLMPYARMMYAADAPWWEVHKGAPAFAGERWSVLEFTKPEATAAKLATADKYDINLIYGAPGFGFSVDKKVLHYGANSGFQAINLALHIGASRVLLVGFNMEGDHFFGKHPLPLRNTDPGAFIRYFNNAAAAHNGAAIINCTPRSELKSFPYQPLESALSS